MKVSVQIEGVEFRMEVETGAAVSILYYTDYERYERYFEYLAVRPSGNGLSMNIFVFSLPVKLK